MKTKSYDTPDLYHIADVYQNDDASITLKFYDGYEEHLKELIWLGADGVSLVSYKDPEPPKWYRFSFNLGYKDFSVGSISFERLPRWLYKPAQFFGAFVFVPGKFNQQVKLGSGIIRTCYIPSFKRVKRRTKMRRIVYEYHIFNGCLYVRIHEMKKKRNWQWWSYQLTTGHIQEYQLHNVTTTKPLNASLTTPSRGEQVHEFKQVQVEVFPNKRLNFSKGVDS